MEGERFSFPPARLLVKSGKAMPDRPSAERLSFAAGDAASDLRVRALNDARVRPSGEMVLYWMQMYRRASDNAALAYAILRANELGLPCVVYESLRPDYPFASDRFHRFVLESARDVAEGLAARGLRHAFFLPRTRDEAKGVLAKLTARAALVVTDDFPSFIVPAQNAALARHATCPVLVVDDNAIVPLALFPKDEIGARTLRPKLARVLGDWLLPLEEPVPRIAAPDRLDLPFEPLRLGQAKVQDVVNGCAIDHSVSAVPELPGGASEAATRADAFVRRRLGEYAADRNDPSRDGTSGLSPYLHFGMLSARSLALRVRGREAARGPDESTTAFLEQLIVRRGLAFTFARNNLRHREYDAVPDWARKTLAEHVPDARPADVPASELIDARSPDPLWNAAQLELRTRGVIQSYARMLWGKLPLTWMKNPRDVHALLVQMNDRFALDGRDPDGYANIGWCFGLHDRPWPSRAIFGTVRSMTSKSARSKLDFESYIDASYARRRDLGLEAPPSYEDPRARERFDE
jgi:deoxyribodipyrimidine photo-lyase